MPSRGQKYETTSNHLDTFILNVVVKTTNILYLSIQKHPKGYDFSLMG